MPRSSTPSDPQSLLTIVRRTLNDHRMLASGDRVLVGVSGGPDSMALLHVLGRLAPELNIRLGVAHLNHGLRGPAAERDAELVRQTAAAANYPCHVGRARVQRVRQGLGLSLEEAGRRVRYAFFGKIMHDGGYDRLALGHHLDDNVEQVLLALLRGTGPRGLCGIAPVRQTRIIRPLIGARRKAIEAYVVTLNIPFAHDESNDWPQFMRNRIRHRLLPLLAADYAPCVHNHLNRLAEIMRSEEAWIETIVDVPYRSAVIDRHADGITLSGSVIAGAPPALARRMVRRAIAELHGNLRRISFEHVAAVLTLAGGRGPEKSLHLPGGLRIRRTADRVMVERVRHRGRLRPPLPAPAPAAVVIAPPFPDRLEIASLGIGLRFFHPKPDGLPPWDRGDQRRAFFDQQCLAPPLTLRLPLPGDRFSPLGAGGSQKISKFLIDHRVSRADRAITPVLTDARRVIWLVGQRMDDSVKITPATTHILGVEFFLLDTR